MARWPSALRRGPTITRGARATRRGGAAAAASERCAAHGCQSMAAMLPRLTVAVVLHLGLCHAMCHAAAADGALRHLQGRAAVPPKLEVHAGPPPTGAGSDRFSATIALGGSGVPRPACMYGTASPDADLGRIHKDATGRGIFCELHGAQVQSGHCHPNCATWHALAAPCQVAPRRHCEPSTSPLTPMFAIERPAVLQSDGVVAGVWVARGQRRRLSRQGGDRGDRDLAGRASLPVRRH